jgi:hypothetical protein
MSGGEKRWRNAAVTTKGIKLNTALSATERAHPFMDRGPWIQTFTGRAFHYLDMRPEEVHIADIAQSLAHQCRFVGQTSRFYSVAEHSVNVSRQFADPELRMIGLLHDATEAYILDLPTPLKDLLPEYRAFEDRLWKVIAEVFDLPPTIPAEIHDIDKRMLITERPQLFPQVIPWTKYANVKPIEGVVVHAYSPGAARMDFLHEYRRIEEQR